jgi:hypothetical protein
VGATFQSRSGLPERAEIAAEKPLSQHKTKKIQSIELKAQNLDFIAHSDGNFNP